LARVLAHVLEAASVGGLFVIPHAAPIRALD
jgi:hypothetical protein